MPENGSLVDQGQPFTDAKGRKWLLTITMYGIKRVKESLNVNIFKLSENKFAGLMELLEDPFRLMDVIHVLCQPQFAAQSVTDQQFEEAIDGEAFSRASEAFLAAYINFSPDPRIRAALRSIQIKGLAALEIITKESIAEAETKMEKATPESMATQLRERFGISAASSESTPDLIAFAPSPSCPTGDAPNRGDAGRDGSVSTPARTG